MPEMQVTDRDEGLHAWGREENWQESAVLAWIDPLSGMGGNHRVSIQPNRGVSNLWCLVSHQRDKMYRLNIENEPFRPMPDGVHGFQCGPQRMFHDGEYLRLQLDQPECSVDLIVHDFKDSVEAFEDTGGLGTIYRSHFNMHCCVTGTVVMNGVKREITNGLGWRDHSWGPRDWSTSMVHRSFHGNFGADLNFHLLVVLTSDGQLVRRGHFVRDGITHKTDRFTTRVEFLEDGVTPVRGACHIFLDNGEKLTFHSEVQKGVFAEVEKFQAFFGHGDCTFTAPDGAVRRNGFTNFEVTCNPRQGTAPIQLTIGNTMQNGYFETKDEPWTYEPL